MKKIILISFLILTCNLFYAQSTSYNLGFSQVLNYEYTSTLSNYSEATVGTLTVPSNKVWKITSGSLQRDDNNSTNSCVLLVGKLTVFENNRTGNYGVANTLLTPIWLSSGTYSVKIQHRSGGTVTFSGGLSIIEFNID